MLFQLAFTFASGFLLGVGVRVGLRLQALRCLAGMHALSQAFCLVQPDTTFLACKAGFQGGGSNPSFQRIAFGAR